MILPTQRTPFDATETGLMVGHWTARAALKAGEAALDKVVDFDGDKTTLSDAAKCLKQAKREAKDFKGFDLRSRVAAVVSAPLAIPLGVLVAPIAHFIKD